MCVNQDPDLTYLCHLHQLHPCLEPGDFPSALTMSFRMEVLRRGLDHASCPELMTHRVSDQVFILTIELGVQNVLVHLSCYNRIP